MLDGAVITVPVVSWDHSCSTAVSGIVCAGENRDTAGAHSRAGGISGDTRDH